MESVGEKEWVRSLLPKFEQSLKQHFSSNHNLRVEAGCKLTYAHEILKYNEHGVADSHRAKYETDLLISECEANGDWIPRVVVECKTGGVTTHDALTYSTKASTHKHVHPYLRYGVLVGNLGSSIPGRLIRHGAYFDFMAVWKSQSPSKREWSDIEDILRSEIEASKTLHMLLTENRKRNGMKISVLHRPLRTRESSQ